MRNGVECIQHAIVDHYIDIITAGQLMPGDALPTLAQESETWGVSQFAVSNARRKLRAAGFITRGNGRRNPARVAEVRADA